MKAFRYMLVATGFAALLVALVMRFGGEEQGLAPRAEAPLQEVRPAQAPAQAPTAAPAASAAVVSVPPMLALPEEIPGEEGEHGEFTTTTDIVKQKIFKSEPQLAQFDYFRQHVLLDSNGRRDYQKLLADRSMYEQTQRALLHPTDPRDDMESNARRLIQIDYLREALSWKENPERQHLVSVVEKIILEDSFGPMMPLAVKRSVAATKTELYEILYAQEPERAKALVDAARNTRLEGMLEYIARNNENRLAKEEALSLRAQRPSEP
jgi:hypothetical protein